ncbi:hypothetical protein WUBG_14138 [Wuchereria bancrofti]|uniref:Uncharacterized protein n=1 Tax=Wuchereria bancrofti TaxID=6293 RepID=J9AL22_WUCBA|nr:hypothetical protein WUBG_14138 [Wuchereria bancrofti]VDM14222.1 unnamed protein product [Wuchereria bancrofti]
MYAVLLLTRNHIGSQGDDRISEIRRKFPTVHNKFVELMCSAWSPCFQISDCLESIMQTGSYVQISSFHRLYLQISGVGGGMYGLVCKTGLKVGLEVVSYRSNFKIVDFEPLTENVSSFSAMDEVPILGSRVRPDHF